MVVFFFKVEDAAVDPRADVLDELLVAHLALAGRVIQVDDLHSFVFGHRQIQLPHGVAELVVAQTSRRVLVPVEERVPHEILFVFSFAGDVREQFLPHFFNKSS